MRAGTGAGWLLVMASTHRVCVVDYLMSNGGCACAHARRAHASCITKGSGRGCHCRRYAHEAPPAYCSAWARRHRYIPSAPGEASGSSCRHTAGLELCALAEAPSSVNFRVLHSWPLHQSRARQSIHLHRALLKLASVHHTQTSRSSTTARQYNLEKRRPGACPVVGGRAAGCAHAHASHAQCSRRRRAMHLSRQAGQAGAQTCRTYNKTGSAQTMARKMAEAAVNGRSGSNSSTQVRRCCVTRIDAALSVARARHCGRGETRTAASRSRQADTHTCGNRATTGTKRRLQQVIMTVRQRGTPQLCAPLQTCNTASGSKNCPPAYTQAVPNSRHRGSTDEARE